jgi:hypothetical protein
MTAADNEVKDGKFEENDSDYDNLSTFEAENIKFNFEQDVSGTGFFAAYKYVQMPDAIGTEGQDFNGVEAKNKAHGSGKIKTDSNIYAESSYTNSSWINGSYDDDGEEIDSEEETTSIIQMKEDSKMAYSPLFMAIGSRYYDMHPIAFNSLLKDEDWIKNRNGLNSLHQMVDQSHGLNKVLDAQSDATNNTMNIEEDLVDGRAHFGVLQLQGIPVDEDLEEEESSEEVQTLGLAMKAWKKPLLELDEDYVGNFKIKKNMNLYTYTDDKEKEDPWLPCCYGGFSDMNYADARIFKSARGVFDCTCFEVPTKAQLSEI